ncbi:DNA adenine methylase [Candidatus Oscillochloris fontis]|uniref:DNA adenine methylase n=1 Tax=Candidatus Oscillochloris fontis TaxID=2496868 RepID=UPI00101BD960|nr:DNA adenine methylase [Candidatus Oscillochloris fontis]
MPARPFLKWVGGKGQLLPELLRRTPPAFGRYHEPFVGGGAFFFSLWNQQRLRQGAVLSDMNHDLIACYYTVRDQVDDLIAMLQVHRAHAHDRDYFYDLRSWDREPDFEQRTAVEKAARVIFLNRTCYNGLYRLNQKGKFNTPFGYYKKPLIVDEENMREVSRALQDVELRQGDFADVLDHAEAGDFVYFDPPYVPLSPTASFTHYTRRGFGEAEQHRLVEVLGELAARGCYVMLSNSSTDLTRQLYHPNTIPGLCAQTVRASRKINCDGTKRGFVDELIACNYDLNLNEVQQGVDPCVPASG